MLPMFPVLAWLFAGTGGVMLTWYQNMTHQQRHGANQLANKLATSMYDKSVQYLTSTQAAQVLTEVRRRLVG